MTRRAGGALRCARFLALTAVVGFLGAQAAPLDAGDGGLRFLQETGGWKYEEQLQWLFAVDAGGGSSYYYSPRAGWMWHDPDFGGWIFSWGFVDAQWMGRGALGRAVQRAAIAHATDLPAPSSHPVTILSAEVEEGRLHVTVEYPGTSPGSLFFLFVENTLEGSDPGRADAWISRNSQGDAGTDLIQEDLVFDLDPMEAEWGIASGEDYTLDLPVFEATAAGAQRVTHDTARIGWETAQPAKVYVEYGTSAGDLSMRTETIDWGETEHWVTLSGLEIDATHYYRPVSVSDSGSKVYGEVHSLKTEALQTASHVTRHGITWTFDGEHTVGQFVNGDWWVLGPVQIVEIDPAPGPHPEGESIADRISANQWGDTSLRDNNAWGNGSMMVMTPSGSQAYDSRNQNYSSSLRIQIPYDLGADRSLISSISHTPDDGYPSQIVFHHIMWPGEREQARVMRTAAVLTSLSEVPPGDAFRPTYIGGEKRIFRLGDLRWDRLANLPLHPRVHADVIPSATEWERFERYLERPWIDHLNGSWMGQLLLPSENQPAYGRENARIVGRASLMLQLDVPRDRKERLLIGLTQIGVDLRGIAELGGRWNAGGGHTSGRKWPILFAGLMFDDDHFFDMPESAIFHEDVQTYWGEGWHGQRALWQMITHHGTRQPYLHLTPAEWPDHDQTGALGGRSGAQVSESYRTCCNANAWPGQTLAALVMEAKETWDHDAYFEVVDDWMREDDIYADQRLGYERHGEEGSGFHHDAFVTDMWRLFRETVPEQPHGDEHRMWDVNQSGSLKWVPNEKPADRGPPVYGPDYPY